MCVKECAVYGAGVLRRFWKEERWESGPGERLRAVYGGEDLRGWAILQACEALPSVPLVPWRRVDTRAQWDSAEARRCDQKLQDGGGGWLSGAPGGVGWAVVPPPGERA